MMISNVGNKLLRGCLVSLLVAIALAGSCFAGQTPGMATVSRVDIGDSTVTLRTDASTVVYKKYTLGAPSRLVIDLMHVIPEFTERVFVLKNGYSAMRVGQYADKTRFVFDVDGAAMPPTTVHEDGSNLIINWGATEPEISTTIAAGSPVAVETIDFDSKNGVTLFKVKFSAAVKLIPPQSTGDVVRFGVHNAVIPRSLRRVVDASVFPSAVLQIVPYSAVVAGERQVMFAVRLKGPVEYAVNTDGSVVTFRCEDGPFAETAADKLTTVAIPVEQPEPAVAATAEDGAVSTTGADQVAEVIKSLENPTVATGPVTTDDGEMPAKIYTGEPVSLVFDDADIRKVMQLLAEVSDMNLVLDDSVQGKVSLRLHDVPWDQALDLVLNVKELGTISQGNVIRVLPLKKIEDMKTRRLQAKQTIKHLEETETRIFSVNYKDVDSIETVLDDMLSDQGEVSAIDGSKKLMVNDIPSKLAEVERLLQELDEPVKQVMIEARIVEANIDSGRDLGINWGYSYNNDDTGSIGTEHVDNAKAAVGGGFLLPSTISGAGLGAAMTFGRTGFDNHVLDLRISALQTSGNGRVISSPKVLTLDGEPAKIEQGTSIPYQSVSDQGTTTEFQDATLSLEVTPEVNPDNTIILQIKASNSTVGSTVSTGAGSAPSIDTKEAETKLLLKDGETTVIGGIYVDSETSSDAGVAWLKDIPYLGTLFKSTKKSTTRSELLIFITPHIVSE